MPVLQKCIHEFTPEPRHAICKNDFYTLNNISKGIVFLWVYPQDGFWYYIHGQTEKMLTGYIKDGRKWIYKPLCKKNIRAYY